MDPDLPMDFSSFGKEEEDGHSGGPAAFSGVPLVVNTPQPDLPPPTPCVDMVVDTPQPMMAPPTPCVDMVVDTPQPEMAPPTPYLAASSPAPPPVSAPDPPRPDGGAAGDGPAAQSPSFGEAGDTEKKTDSPAAGVDAAVAAAGGGDAPVVAPPGEGAEPADRPSPVTSGGVQASPPAAVHVATVDDAPAPAVAAPSPADASSETSPAEGASTAAASSAPTEPVPPPAADNAAVAAPASAGASGEVSVMEQASPAHSDPSTSAAAEQTSAAELDAEPGAAADSASVALFGVKQEQPGRLAQIIADMGPAGGLPPEPPPPLSEPQPQPTPAEMSELVAPMLPATVAIKQERIVQDELDPDYEPELALPPPPPPPPPQPDVHCLVCNDPLTPGECVQLTQHLENAPVRIEEKIGGIINNDYRLYLHSEVVCDRCHHTLCEIHELEVQTKQLKDQVVGFFWDTVEVRHVRPQRKGRRKSRPSKLLLEANETAMFMPEVELREGSPVIHKAPPKKLNRWSKPKVYEKLSNNEYQCIRCHKILPRMRAVTKHFDLVHGPKEEQCNICQKYVRDKPHLIKHKIKAHPEEWAVEKAAEEAAAAEAALNAPLIKQEAEDGEPVAGPSTDPDLPMDGLGAHSEDSESITERAPLIEDEFDEEAECEEIDEDVAMNIEVERPRRRGRKRRYSSHSYGNELGTMYTEELDGDAPRYQCMLCANSYSRTAKARDHFIAKHAQIKRFKCNICQEAFLTYKQKRHHELSHTAELCPKCGKKYPGNKRGMLERHINQCGEVKKCRICDAEFLSMQEFVKHRRDAHEKSATCDVCGKVVSARNLASHRAIHSDERNYTCHLCGASFKAKGSLDTHLRTHSEDRPFSCDQCGKSFKHRNNWKDHERGHLNIRDFVCHFCSKSFKQAKNLKQHLRQHDANPEIFTCPHCPSTFKYKYNMLAHVKTLHTGEMGRRVRRRMRAPSEMSGVSMAGPLGGGGGPSGLHHHPGHPGIGLDPLQLSPGSVTSDSNSGVHVQPAGGAPGRVLPQLNPLNQAGVVFMQSLQHHSIFSS